MAHNRQPDFKPNNHPSSSDDDEEEEEEEEEEEASGSEDEQTSCSESEEQEPSDSEPKHEPKKPLIPPPQSAKKPQQPPDLSSSGTEDSDSDTDSDSPPKKSSIDPTIKPISSKPMEREEGTTYPAKRSGSGSKPSSTPSPAKAGKRPPPAASPAVEKDLKKAKKSTAADEDSKKQLFQRLWSEDDEIVILKGMIDYKTEKNGENPVADMGAFHEFIKKALHVDVSRAQLVDKVRRLKKKYVNNASREKNGKDRSFSLYSSTLSLSKPSLAAGPPFPFFPAMPPPSTSINRTASDGGTIILNKYQLTRLLGRGSFAKVYHGRSLSDDSSVAVKVIEKPAVADPAMEPRLVREVAAMRRLNHPNILKLHEVLATKTKIYLVMELAAGGELFTQLSRRGRMKEATARRYFQQIVSTLSFCHQNGVAHRDLKPQNLLLDEQGSLKISDFGLSALPESQKDGLLHTACGTPAYTAPEIVRRRGYDGAKADAWSCGVILFVFLAGYLPFDDSNLANMYRKIHQREFVFPDWIPKQPRIIIQKLLDPNPKTRMSIETLIGLPWFRKSLRPDPIEFSGESESESGSESEGSSIKYKMQMNAFDIISMSSGLNLSGIFEEKIVRKERRFTTAATAAEVEQRVAEVGERLGFRLKRMKDKENWNMDVVGLVKGRVVVVAKVLEVAVELLLVEMAVVAGGGDGGFSDVEWEELTVGFQDLVVSWQC